MVCPSCCPAPARPVRWVTLTLRQACPAQTTPTPCHHPLSAVRCQGRRRWQQRAQRGGGGLAVQRLGRPRGGPVPLLGAGPASGGHHPAGKALLLAAADVLACLRAMHVSASWVCFPNKHASQADRQERPAAGVRTCRPTASLLPARLPARLPRCLQMEGVQHFACPIVMEGGSIHVDGEGTLLTTGVVGAQRTACQSGD